MAIPLGVASTLVTARFLHASIDSDDDDREPDGIPADGLLVRITATTTIVRNLNTSPPTFVSLDPIEVFTTSDGVLTGRDDEDGIRIVASDDPNLRATEPWYYIATVSGPNWPTQVIPFVAKSNGNFDLVRDADIPVDVEGAITEYQRLKLELQAMIDKFNGTAIAVLG